jgi:hypothetical protein
VCDRFIEYIDRAHTAYLARCEDFRKAPRCDPWHYLANVKRAAFAEYCRLQDAATAAFAERNGWRASPSYFGTETLAKGGVHRSIGYEGERGPLSPRSVFDHVVRFLERARPYRTVAIVGQPYMKGESIASQCPA